MLRFIAFVAAFFLAAAAHAQDVFTVPEVPVFAEAETSSEARDSARLSGEKAAMDILLRRLTAEEDWVYLPSLSTGQPAPIFAQGYGGYQRDADLAYRPNASEPVPVGVKRPITIEDPQLDALVETFDVFDEKSSGTTYRASITFRFKADSVRTLLQNARLPYSEEQARRVLILPVLETENGRYLWEAKNPWARAWLERPLTSELTPMDLPVGDAMDIQAITADEAANLNTPALRAFSERYQTERLLLAVGRLREQAGEYRLTVRLIEATPPAIDARTISTSSIGTTVTEVYVRGSNDDFPALARQAVETTVQRHARQWKRQTLVDYSQQRTFELTAWYSNQAEWAHIRESVQATPLVVDFQSGVFNSVNAIMTITAVGAEDQFDLAMQQRDLDVWKDVGGRWHVADLEQAAVLKEQLVPLTTDIDDQNTRRRGLGRFFGRGDRSEQDEVIEEGALPDLPDDMFGDDNNQQ